jgi:hypothetical protein
VQGARTHRLLRAAVVVAVLLVTAGEVRARTVVVATRLDYVVQPGCPAVDSFQAVVTGQLGYDPFRADAPDVVNVRIASAGRTLEGHLEWRDPTGRAIGEQTFPSRSGDCAELVRAMGFALAVQIELMAATVDEPRWVQPPPPPPTETAAPKSSPPPPVARIESAAARASDSSAALRGPSVLAGAGAFAGFGVSSKPTAVGRLFVTAAWSRVAVELGGELSVPSTTYRADGAGFSQEDFMASLAACWLRVPFSVCGVGKVGEMRVVGQGVSVPLTASGLMAEAGLRVAFSFPLGDRTYLVAHVEGVGHLTQGTVTLDSMPVWTTPSFAALLGLDVAVRFR